MKCSSALQAGDKPAEAHKRTLELESPAEALGPAEKKRIVESSTGSGAAAAVIVKAEHDSASAGQQNGFGAHPASSAPAETDREGTAGQAMKQEPVADDAKSADAGRDVSMTDASAKPGSDAKSLAPQAGDKQGSLAPNGVPVKQEQQDQPVLHSSQQGRATMPELKIERLDARTGQVRCTHMCIVGLQYHVNVCFKGEVGPDMQLHLCCTHVLEGRLFLVWLQLISFCKASAPMHEMQWASWTRCPVKH